MSVAILDRRHVPLMIYLSWFALAAIVSGCVTNELHSAEAARRAYDECVVEYSASNPDCEMLHARLLDAQRQYDEQGRRAWGCRPEDDTCPMSR